MVMAFLCFETRNKEIINGAIFQTRKKKDRSSRIVMLSRRFRYYWH